MGCAGTDFVKHLIKKRLYLFLLRENHENAIIYRGGVGGGRAEKVKCSKLVPSSRTCHVTYESDHYLFKRWDAELVGGEIKADI